MSIRDWKFWAATIGGIAVAGAIGKYMGRRSAEEVNARSDAIPSHIQDPRGDVIPSKIGVDGVQSKIAVLATSQDAGKVTSEQLDMNFLKGIEEWTVERTKAKISKALAANGLPAKTPEVTSEAGYLEISDNKLAVIRTYTEDANGVRVWGIVGNELKSVSCVQESQEKVPITFGECADNITAVFGVAPR